MTDTGAPPAPAPAPPAPPALPVEPATGFPADTPVAEMTVDQQAAYWKHQSRKHEERARSREDYDAVKAKAAELDKIREQQMSETEKAVNKAREEALAEGKRQAMTDLSTKYTRAMLETALTTRGRTPEQVETLLRHVNFESYVANGEPDTDAIAAYADSIAGPVTGGGQVRGPDHGQGNRGQQGKARGLEAGAAMYRERHGTPQ
jgi:DNA-binding helix-hairpin-helix protein with protein kinase domain